MPYVSFVRNIKKACSTAGYDSQFYAGHSLRAGGATDLFVARVPDHIIKKAGRWKSDAALYYRSESDVCNAVKQGFGLIAKEIRSERLSGGSDRANLNLSRYEPNSLF